MTRKLSPTAWLLIVLAVVLLMRLISLSFYPLMDTTEARYAEMARKILETGDWVTPWFDYGVPFWGKPILSFWASAVTMMVAGVNEFGARLAPFIASILSGLLFYAWPFKEHQKAKATAAFIVMQTTVLGFIASGAVMTDEFLFLGICLSLVSFWKVMCEDNVSKLWQYLFFVGLAIGLLSKGPLVAVMVGFPIFFWVLIQRKWGDLWRKLPWFTGIILMLVLTVPWYIAAENATPGFLRYFIIGEHFERFLVSGWKGDLYGTGHARAFGTIWLYGLLCTLPWLILVPFFFRKRILKKNRSENLFLLLWILAPLLFFTAASNILPAYSLPLLFPFCIITANALFNMFIWYPKSKYIWLVPVLGIIILAVCINMPFFNEFTQVKSQKRMLKAWNQTTELIYVDSRPYSGQLYTSGRGGLIDDVTPEEAIRIKNITAPTTLIMRSRTYNGLGFVDDTRWQMIAQDKKENPRWVMIINY